jgi:tetratricopeptide (TPR) repeat protein
MFSSFPSPLTSISQKNQEFNYNLFEKLNEDELSQQILLTIALFCLLKKKNISEEAKILINKYNYPHYDMIFPLILLKAKYFIKTKNIPKAIDILNEAIYLYEDYKLHLDEKKNDLKNIYTIETFHQKFKYFDNLFNYLFCMNRLDVKIKKLYFELKLCLITLKFYSQAYKIILELHEKYPDDILIQFELAKDSVLFSKPDKFQEILEEMKKNRDNQTDENTIKIYNNFILYAEGMSELAQCKYDETKNKFEEILKNDENNVLIKNNIGVLNIYKNNPKECHEKLMTIYQDKKNESGNEYIRSTLKTIQEKFNIKSSKQ